MERLEEFVSGFLPYQLEQLLKSVSLVNVTDECGIRAVGNDDIFQAYGGD